MSLNEEMINQQGEAQEAEENEAQQAELSPIQELEEKLAETEDRYKRVLAEYQNFRTRSQKEREAMYLDNVASTVNGFLPVIDTLERAMLQETDERFKKSIEMIIKQYTDCLDHFNVKAYAERGDVFDPNLHNAVMMCDDDELESGAIAEVLLKGYILGDKRVVRHAMVRVAN